MAGELREENMRNAETANIWSIQTEKKKGRYGSAEAEKKKGSYFLFHNSSCTWFLNNSWCCLINSLLVFPSLHNLALHNFFPTFFKYTRELMNLGGTLEAFCSKNEVQRKRVPNS